MSQLSRDEILYLLYVLSYSREEESATKGTIKSSLSRDKKETAKAKLSKEIESIYNSLLEQGLINVPKKSRITVTSNGVTALVSSLKEVDDYFFDSQKGAKVLNALIDCLKHSASQSGSKFSHTEKLSFSNFSQKFQEVYFEERKRQELSGVVAIQKQDLYAAFHKDKTLSVDDDLLDTYFNQLKAEGKIFTSKGEKDELIHLAE